MGKSNNIQIKERNRKFLVTSEPTTPMPPEAAPGLMDALIA
jgi:hypothetical protein